jgi:hypothetical protein
VGIKAEHLSQIRNVSPGTQWRWQPWRWDLGLYIVKRLAGILGAEIDASSAPERGSPSYPCADRRSVFRSRPVTPSFAPLKIIDARGCVTKMISVDKGSYTNRSTCRRLISGAAGCPMSAGRSKAIVRPMPHRFLHVWSACRSLRALIEYVGRQRSWPPTAPRTYQSPSCLLSWPRSGGADRDELIQSGSPRRPAL